MSISLRGGSLFQDFKNLIVSAINNSILGNDTEQGLEYRFVYGENNDLALNATEDVVSYGTLSYLPDNVGTITITCVDANDTLNGTGAHEVYIKGILEDWSETTVRADLDGNNTVTLGVQMRRINEAVTGVCGSNKVNHDNINIFHNGTQISQIQAGHGRSQNATFTVPLGKTGEITQYWASISDDQANEYADLHLQIYSNLTNPLHGWHVIIDSNVKQGIPILVPINGIYVNEGDDIVVRARGASSANIHLFANFTVKLYPTTG